MPETVSTTRAAAFGTSGNDSLRGGSGDDSILGFAGDDTLIGGGGNDTLDGGPGIDLIEGSGLLRGGSEPDVLKGASGDDTLEGGSGGDVLEAGSGNDLLKGGTGQDVMRGDGGNDLMEGEGGDDIMEGGAGDDTLIGGTGTDRLLGGDGDDSLDGGAVLPSGASSLLDSLDGGAGNDTLRGGADYDAMTGGFGDDTFIGQRSDFVADDISDFEKGDRLEFTDVMASEISVSVETTQTKILFDRDLDGNPDVAVVLKGTFDARHFVVEALTGGSGASVIYDDPSANLFEGGPGDDTVRGTSRDDTLLGHDGNDLLASDDGNDSLEGGAGNDTIEGGPGKDTLMGGFDDDHLTGGAGDDDIFGGFGDDTLLGGEDSDRLFGGPGNDSINDGDRGHDSLVGGPGNDTLTTSYGQDTLFGGAGDDVVQSAAGGYGNHASLYGGDGDDTLIPGWADTTLIGGSGDDRFVVSPFHLHRTTIVDFFPGDELELQNTPVMEFRFLERNEFHDKGVAILFYPDHRGRPSKNVFLEGDYTEGTFDTAPRPGGAGQIITYRGPDPHGEPDPVEVPVTGDETDGGTGDDHLQGFAGNDVLRGLSGDDTLEAAGGRDLLEGGLGADLLRGGEGADTLTGGTGRDRFTGTVEEVLGDEITDFSASDTIAIDGAAATDVDVVTEAGQTVVRVLGAEAIVLRGDYGHGTFTVADGTAGVEVTYTPWLPGLAERVAVADARINGMTFKAPEPSPDTPETMSVHLDTARSRSEYHNVLGVYEVDHLGRIVNVRILAEDTKAPSDTWLPYERPELPGDYRHLMPSDRPFEPSFPNPLGFFIVQGAANWAKTLTEADTLSFIDTTDGTPAEVTDGPHLQIAVNGRKVGANVFHSWDRSLNPDGLEHVVSGVIEGGDMSRVYVGFEDVLGGGDMDFQDVVFFADDWV